MREITGRLLAADNSPLRGALMFRVLESVPPSLPAGAPSTATLSADGSYAIALIPGRYAIHYTPLEGQPRKLGECRIDAGPPADVLTLLECFPV